ncbi:spore germination protein GerPC [Gracilibacillus sp. YIM 98692]|uniref:spore germination protein GerPC n=1 Tax=Gracilibacillus sp. YIM 98692 TaxID=2663532 RepID=UPI0013D8D192|nr:spore germination protein GerPC [Gracilibacillus sp. YIM 98692]
MNDQNLYYYLSQLQQQMNQLHDHINSLEARLKQIEQSSSNKTNIEKLEYHFDQLKIERLDGTLHIGVTPDELQQMDDFSLPLQQSMPPTIQEEINQYMENEIPSYIQELEQEYQHSLDNQFRQALIDDIKKQLPQRIEYYQQANMPPNQLHQHVTSNVKNEMIQGLRKWFTQHSKKE